MVYFDVKNLFIQVPIDEALRVTRENFPVTYPIDPASTIITPQLVEVCLRSSYFQFQDSLDEQVDDTAMGSPLYPNLYMERLEETAISSKSFKPGL